MALTAEKISKLRELADRGVDGEKDNAKQILTKHGIDWKKPKETIVTSFKKAAGFNIVKEYNLPIEYSADIVLLSVILITLKIKTKGIIIHFRRMDFKCTPAESVLIGKIFYANREKFNDDIFAYAYTKILIT